MVGDDAVYLVGIGDVDEAALVELGRVKHGNHFVRLLDHDLVEQRFLHARRRDSVLYTERIHSQKQLVAAEVTQHRQCQRAYRGVAVHAHIASQQHHVETLVVHQLCGYVHRVGDDMQVMETVQMSSHLKRSRAGVEHHKIAILDHLGSLFANALLLTEIEHLLLRDGYVLVLVLHGFTHGSATGTHQQVAALQNSQILSNRNFRDTSFATKFRNQNFLFGLQLTQDKCSAFLCR